MERSLLYCLNVLSVITLFGFNQTYNATPPPLQPKDVRNFFALFNFFSLPLILFRSRYLFGACPGGVVFNSAITFHIGATHIVLSSKSQGKWFGNTPAAYEACY